MKTIPALLITLLLAMALLPGCTSPATDALSKTSASATPAETPIPLPIMATFLSQDRTVRPAGLQTVQGSGLKVQGQTP